MIPFTELFLYFKGVHFGQGEQVQQHFLEFHAAVKQGCCQEPRYWWASVVQGLRSSTDLQHGEVVLLHCQHSSATLFIEIKFLGIELFGRNFETFTWNHLFSFLPGSEMVSIEIGWRVQKQNEYKFTFDSPSMRTFQMMKVPSKDQPPNRFFQHQQNVSIKYINIQHE